MTSSSTPYEGAGPAGRVPKGGMTPTRFVLMLLAGFATLFTAPIGLLAAPAPDSTPPALNSLVAPASPAFVLLGITPTSVARPRTPSDLALIFLNQTNSLTQVPTDFSLETSPYWLAPRPGLTWSADTTRHLWHSIMRTFAVSVATAQIGDSATSSTGLSVGMRTALVSGRTSSASIATLEALQVSLGNRAKKLNERRIKSGGLTIGYGQLQELAALAEKELAEVLESRQQREWWEMLRSYCRSLPDNVDFSRDSLAEQMIVAINSTDECKACNKLIVLVKNPDEPIPEEELAAYNDSLRAQETSSLKDFEPDRVGFKLEVAGGLIWGFPDNIASRGKIRGGGVWTTASYSGESLKNAEFLATVRYLNNDLLTPSEDVLDLGLRAIYRLNVFTFSYEYVRRIPEANFSSDGQLYRHALLFEVDVSPGKRLSLTIGEDFNRKAAESFLAQIAFSIGLRNLGLTD